MKGDARIRRAGAAIDRARLDRERVRILYAQGYHVLGGTAVLTLVGAATVWPRTADRAALSAWLGVTIALLLARLLLVRTYRRRDAFGRIASHRLWRARTAAIKYTDRERVSLVAAPTVDGRVALSVRDTGHGIPAAEQDRVFSEYHQLENPARDRNKGLGLGLAIVRRLCALMDSSIALVSAPGEGSTFTVTLSPGTMPERYSDPGGDGERGSATPRRDDAAKAAALRWCASRWSSTTNVRSSRACVSGERSSPTPW